MEHAGAASNLQADATTVCVLQALLQQLEDVARCGCRGARAEKRARAANGMACASGSPSAWMLPAACRQWLPRWHRRKGMVGLPNG